MEWSHYKVEFKEKMYYYDVIRQINNQSERKREKCEPPKLK